MVGRYRLRDDSRLFSAIGIFQDNVELHTKRMLQSKSAWGKQSVCRLLPMLMKGPEIFVLYVECRVTQQPAVGQVQTQRNVGHSFFFHAELGNDHRKALLSAKIT
jgi:hypothetical protein